MAPRDVWRLLYRTQPLNPSKSSSKSSNEDEVLGHMDIAWRSAMGETGRLLTQDYKVEVSFLNKYISTLFISVEMYLQPQIELRIRTSIGKIFHDFSIFTTRI